MATNFIKFLGHLIQRTANRHGYEIKQSYPRPSIKFMKEHFGDRKLKGAEIGVFEGINAKSICDTLYISKLYLIDPYIEGYGKIFPTRIRGLTYEDILIRAKKLLQNKPVEFIRKTSDEAVNDVPKNLDFIYIDANHQYEFVKRDLENYYPKLKKGGVLCGHDIENGYNPYPEGNNVPKALIEFCYEKKLQLYIQAPDWWIIKP